MNIPRTRAHSHGSKNLPCSAAWVVHRPSPLLAVHHPTQPEPQHRSRSASRPRCLCGQPQHGEQLAGRRGRRLQRSCQPPPGYSSTATAHHRHQNPTGFPGLSRMSSSRSWLSLLFLPPARANVKRNLCQGSLLWTVPCKIEDSRRTSWPQTGTWWWDAEGICNCPLMHPDWGAWK